MTSNGIKYKTNVDWYLIIHVIKKIYLQDINIHWVFWGKLHKIYGFFSVSRLVFLTIDAKWRTITNMAKLDFTLDLSDLAFILAKKISQKDITFIRIWEKTFCKKESLYFLSKIGHVNFCIDCNLTIITKHQIQNNNTWKNSFSIEQE